MTGLRPLATGIGLLVLIAGCSGGEERRPALVDGSAARSPAVTFQRADGAVVATRVRVAEAAKVARLRSCVAVLGRRATGRVVERIGVRGASVTFLDPQQRKAYACDSLGGAWCGWASARLGSSGVDDARLTLSCRSSEETTVGFAWIEPGRGTRWVVIEQDGIAEGYATAGDSPIRVVSTDTDLESATARFRVSEFARDGTWLRDEVVEAQVAD
ncbi:MAG TPA: hypothetical protein VFU99_01150 [Gaiellaceae bacterium]|nr:hypothetical protein [Gaiellaceae bacterium]